MIIAAVHCSAHCCLLRLRLRLMRPPPHAYTALAVDGCPGGADVGSVEAEAEEASPLHGVDRRHLFRCCSGCTRAAGARVVAANASGSRGAGGTRAGMGRGGTGESRREAHPSIVASIILLAVASIILLAMIIAAVHCSAHCCLLRLRLRLMRPPPHAYTALAVDGCPGGADVGSVEAEAEEASPLHGVDRRHLFRCCSGCTRAAGARVVAANASGSRGAGGTRAGTARGGTGESRREAHPSIPTQPRCSTVAILCRPPRSAVSLFHRPARSLVSSASSPSPGEGDWLRPGGRAWPCCGLDGHLPGKCVLLEAASRAQTSAQSRCSRPRFPSVFAPGSRAAPAQASEPAVPTPAPQRRRKLHCKPE